MGSSSRGSVEDGHGNRAVVRLLNARTRLDASSYQSSGRREPRRTLLEEPEDDPGEVTLEGPDRLLPGVALGDLAGDERAGRGEPPGLGEGNYVKRPVELAVARPGGAHPVHPGPAPRDRWGAGGHRHRV